MHTLTDIHCYALKRLLWYLHGTIRHHLPIHHNSPLHIHAFTDADWAGDKKTYISITGYIVYQGSNLIAWSSKLQPTLIRSSSEAEFCVVASTTTKVQWISNV